MARATFRTPDNEEFIGQALTNCPFCDGSPNVYMKRTHDGKSIIVKIKCTNCWVTMTKSGKLNDFKYYLKQAIYAWNKRPADNDNFDEVKTISDPEQQDD